MKSGRPVLLILLLLLPVLVHAQVNKHFRNGPIISVKAGYHTKDGKDEYNMFPYDNGVPAGFCIDATAEIPTGRGWYIGLNYDLSFGNESRFDTFENSDVIRSMTMFNFSPLVKYRFISGDVSVNLGLGIGSSKVVFEYDRGSLKETKATMANFNFRFGSDYALTNHILVSVEGVYYGMQELSFDGGGRSNSIFQIKAGLGFVFK
ncbi:MAG TPA: outer membrane beta-barrel protein [Ignavibacteria bacterium]|nr:outer membrane beta-barrel protein [Ignavibacteria bacterium]HMR00409.1 outer membrane beta-barrel protein [Ignavibacteria bacterium]